MEQHPKHHQKQLIKSHDFLKNITKLLLSVSVFSLLFSHSSWFSFNLCAFLSHSLDKNYIFLLFNGLVVYLAKTSGLISSASKHTHFNQAHDHYHYHYLDGLKPEPLSPEAEAPLLKKDVADETNESHQEDDHVVEATMTSYVCVIQEKETQKLIFVQQEEEDIVEEEEEENGSMSTEELNKKFDDFIRKMKEDLRIQAQQQLIMVL